MSWLDILIAGYRTVANAGNLLVQRSVLNFTNATAVDNPATGMTDVTCPVSTPIPRLVPVDGATSIQWKFAETSGASAWANSIGGGCGLTVAYGSVVSGTPAVFDNGIVVDGSGGVLSTTDVNITLGANQLSFSVSAWVFCFRYTGGMAIASKRFLPIGSGLSQPGSQAWLMSMNNSSSGAWQFSIPTKALPTDPTAPDGFTYTMPLITADNEAVNAGEMGAALVPIGQWVLLSATVAYDSGGNSTTVKSYVNGRPGATGSHSGCWDSGRLNRYNVGGLDDSPHSPFNGMIDDVRVEAGVVRTQDYYDQMYRRAMGIYP